MNLRRGDEALSHSIQRTGTSLLDGGPGQGTKLSQDVAHYLQQRQLISKHPIETTGKEDSGRCPESEE